MSLWAAIFNSRGMRVKKSVGNCANRVHDTVSLVCRICGWMALNATYVGWWRHLETPSVINIALHCLLDTVRTLATLLHTDTPPHTHTHCAFMYAFVYVQTSSILSDCCDKRMLTPRCFLCLEEDKRRVHPRPGGNVIEELSSGSVVSTSSQVKSPRKSL